MSIGEWVFLIGFELPLSAVIFGLAIMVWREILH